MGRVKFKKRLILLFVFFLLSFPAGAFASGERHPSIEIVESVPVETSLDVPEVRNTEEVWLEMINGAKKTLDIEVFYFANRQGEPMEKVLESIRDAAHRGVRVRIICEESFMKETAGVLKMLDGEPGISYRWINSFKSRNGIMHAKYFVVDGRIVFLGSMNFDWRSLKHISEMGAKIEHEGFAQCATNLFEMDWSLCNGKKPSWGKSHYNIPFKLDEKVEFYPLFTPLGMIPDNRLWENRELLKLIGRAKKEILFQVLTYSPVSRENTYWAELDCAIREAALRGVKVKIILSDWSTRKPGIDYIKSLAMLPNIEIRLSTIPRWSGGFIPYARVQHSKFLVIDDSCCWIGSNNWEKNYFYGCRGLGIVLRSERLTAQVRKIFFTSWTSTYAHDIDVTKEYVPPQIGE